MSFGEPFWSFTPFQLDPVRDVISTPWTTSRGAPRRDDSAGVTDSAAPPIETRDAHVMKVDIREDPDFIYFDVESPGVEKADIDVNTTDRHSLTIKYKKKELTKGGKEPSHRYRQRERSFGDMERVLKLPRNTTTEGVTAELLNGVLIIKVPKVKVPKETSHHIEIQ